MITMPVSINDSEYSLFVFLTKENVDRITSYDPAVIDTNKYSEFMKRKIKDVHIGFVNEEEEAEMMKSCGKGLKPQQVMDLLKRLGRGWTYKPGDGTRPLLGVKLN